jgi:phage replication O-like protein O
MANPQLENGHTRIANELMEQLMKLYLAPNQWQIFLCIMRKTYGFHKKIDYVTNTQICEATRLVKSTVSRSIEVLSERNIVTRDGKRVGVQKDWEQWLTWKEYQRKLADRATKVDQLANSIDGEKLADRKQKLAVTQPKLADRATKVSSPVDTQKEDTIQKKLSKRKYGEFQNVLLSDEEYQKLKDKLGDETESYIEKLSSYMESKGRRYKNHCATVLNWYQGRKEGNATNRNPRELPKAYTESPDYADL